MEFWHYLVFPAAALFLGNLTYRGIIRWNTLLLLGLVAFLPLEYLAYFVVWLMGVAAAVIRIPVRRALLWAAVLVATMVNSRVGMGTMYVRDLFIGFACALLICAVKNGCGFSSAFAEIHQRLSGFSYSVYLIHFPLLVFFLSVLNQCGLSTGTGGIGSRFGRFSGLLLLCTGASYALSLVTEARTPEIRKALLSWISAKRHSLQEFWFR